MRLKKLYEAPETEVLDLMIEGVIAASGDPQFNAPFGDSEEEW